MDYGTCLEMALPIIIYLLLIILIVVFIMVLVKSYNTLGRVNKLIDNVNDRVGSLENVLNILDNATDTFSHLSDKLVGLIIGGVQKIFKKKGDIEEDE
jgi:hypothetical protein